MIETSKTFKTGFKNNNMVHHLTENERKNIQGILLEMLCAIDEVCIENEIAYCLCGGSAIGAMRHSGFIPWDDDLDIFMLRKDVRKFAEIIHKKYGNLYEVKTPGFEGFFESPSTTISRKGTIFRSYGELQEKTPGVCCDICILENASDNFIIRFLHGVGSLIRGGMTSCRRFYRDRKILLKYANSDSEIIKAIKVKANIGCLLSLFSYEHYVRKQYEWNSRCKNNNTSKIVCPNGRAHYFGEIYDRTLITKAVRHEFCGKDFMIPYNAHKYLTGLYGEYMNVPEENEREAKVVFELKL